MGWTGHCEAPMRKLKDVHCKIQRCHDLWNISDRYLPERDQGD